MPEGTYPISESINSFKNQQVKNIITGNIAVGKISNFGSVKILLEVEIYFREKFKNKN